MIFNDACTPRERWKFYPGGGHEMRIADRFAVYPRNGTHVVCAKYMYSECDDEQITESSHFREESEMIYEI